MIKKYFSLFIFLLIPGFINAEIIDKKFNPTSPLIAIFQTFSPLLDEEQRIKLQNPTLENLNSIAQKAFLRPADTDRRDMPRDPSHFADIDIKRAQLLFQEINDMGAIEPKQQYYNYILLNGSTVKNMQQRLQSLIRFINEEKVIITPETQVVFLAGERDLFDTELPSVPNTCKTEADAAEWVWYQAPLTESLKTVKISFVREPKTKKEDGTLNRLTTAGTIHTWINTQNPMPGSCLAISSQPFVYYQGLIIKSLLPDFEIEVAGDDLYSSENFPENIRIYLDNLARTIYTALGMKKAAEKK